MAYFWICYHLLPLMQLHYFKLCSC